MLRWIAIIITSFVVMAFVMAVFPSLYHTAFVVAGRGVAWGWLVGTGVIYLFHRGTK